MLTYRWFAKVYHWTPAQVDELPADVVTWFPLIEESVDRVTEAKQKQEMKAQQARR